MSLPKKPFLSWEENFIAPNTHYETSQLVRKAPESISYSVHSEFQRLFIHPELTPKVVEKSIDSLLAGFDNLDSGEEQMRYLMQVEARIVYMLYESWEGVTLVNKLRAYYGGTWKKQDIVASMYHAVSELSEKYNKTGQKIGTLLSLSEIFTSFYQGFQPATHGERGDYKKLSPLNMTLTDEELKQNTRYLDIVSSIDAFISMNADNPLLAEILEAFRNSKKGMFIGYDTRNQPMYIKYTDAH